MILLFDVSGDAKRAVESLAARRVKAAEVVQKDDLKPGKLAGLSPIHVNL
jgi:hypothetical protein